MELNWWQRGVIYQIYPRSFQDTNGDGIGDLPGIERRLDYLATLGLDAVWLSPIFPSPMADFGYDVADYCGVDPIFGTLADLDRLIAAAHARGLKLILDFVPNHSSDEHPWFVESRSSRDNPKRDWYIWRDPTPDGGVPNNWLSEFGGSAWEWHEATGQYYYHAFHRKQPDLNWRNPDVVAAMHDVLRFWMKRGVDGFRVDVIYHMIKDDQFRDNPSNPDHVEGSKPFNSLVPVMSIDRPEVQVVVTGLRRVVDEFEDRVLIGEIYLPIERLVAYYGADLDGVHLPFNFNLLLCPWDPAHVAKLIREYEAALPPGGWPNWVLGNHDQPRVASRVGRAQARVAAMLLLTLRGTPTLYYGDEIGMENVPIPLNRVQDPAEKQMPGIGEGRDPERTPMQWTADSHAGFSDAEPWLPLAEDAATRNVEVQSADPRSELALNVALLALRRAEPALAHGKKRVLECPAPLLAFERCTDEQRLLVVLNFAAEPASFTLPEGTWQRLLSTHLDDTTNPSNGALKLRPDEGVVLRAG